MSDAEYHELYLMVLDSISSVWELWIAITFALVVATYLGREILTQALTKVVVLLYVMMSLVLIMRYVGYAQMNYDLLGRMHVANVAPLEHTLAPMIFAISLLLMIVGSLATSWFSVWIISGDGI